MINALARSPLHIRIALVVLGLAAAVATYQGWRLFWFLTDDAYIAFRYISNSVAGHGYTWNPPPFRPVEGYSSFLWIAILDGIWRVFDIEPPESANWLSLLCAYGTLGLVAAMVLRYELSDAWGPARIWALGLVFLGITSNRTFMAWNSSGLETALFMFLLHFWVYAVLYIRRESRAWSWSVSGATVLVYLCRPDGMLVVLATLAIFAVHLAFREHPFDRTRLFGLVPLLAIPLHFGWRYARYGEWLPNTYYAKHVAPWPESGVRYFGSFVLEYALWIWILAGLAWLALRGWPLVRRHWARPSPHALYVTIIALTFLGHLGYYTLRIGGDHFEYRVYNHLVPIAFMTFPWLLDRLSLRRPLALALFVAFIACSWPIPWTHWQATKDLNTREETFKMTVAVADALPGWLHWYTGTFDDLQAWLIDHSACTRHQEHKIFLAHQKQYLPEREVILRQFTTSAESIGPFPVVAFGSVGVVGWRMAPINVIDIIGLNDYVIARNPVPPHHGRLMAHDRFAPTGYVECFSPNVEPRISLDQDQEGRPTTLRRYLRIVPRPEPLTAAKIRDCETRSWR